MTDAGAITLQPTDPALPGILEDEVVRARAYMAASRAAATRRAYAADWRVFTDWCGSRGLDLMPASPVAVAVFLTAMKDGDAAVDPPRARRRSRRCRAISPRSTTSTARPAT